MFEFKLPIFEYTQEFLNAENEKKKDPLYLKTYLEKDFYRGMQLFRDNNGLVMYQGYKNYLLDDKSQEIVKDWVLDSNEIEAKKEYFASFMKTSGQNGHKVAINILCPYTFLKIDELYASDDTYYNRKKVKLNFIDEDGIPESIEVEVGQLGKMYVSDITKSAIKKYYRPKTFECNFYSDPVMALFKEEWGFDNTLIKSNTHLDVRFDGIHYVKVYYESTDANETKSVYLNFDKGRYFKFKGKTHYIESKEIEDFDEKLQELLTNGVAGYRHKYKPADLEDERNIALIEAVMANKSTPSEKILAIKEIVK